MTPEEIYANHHKTATRPNPFLPNDTLRAMEEYAQQEVKKAIEATRAEYGADTTGLIDELAQAKKDIIKLNSLTVGYVWGPVNTFLKYKEKIRVFSVYINEKYEGKAIENRPYDERREPKKRKK